MAFSTESSLWAVIPVRSRTSGKLRLMLAGDDRPGVDAAALDPLLDEIARLFPTGHIVVVSSDEGVLTVARRHGVRGLRDSADGDVNDALAAAALFATERGATGILSISAELPALTAHDLRAMIAAFDADNVVIAPDRAGMVADAVLMAPNQLPFRHGPNSMWGYLDVARDAKLPFEIVRRSSLTGDIDAPEHHAA